MKATGIVLIVIGAILMIFTGFNLVTEKKVVDLGKLEISKEENHPISWSPILGGALLVGGIVLVIVDKKK